MKISAALALVATLAVAASAAPAYSTDSGWKVVGDAAGTVKFHIALAHANPTAIVNKLYEVSDPASPEYGNHWTREELKQHSKPVDGAVKRVTTWLSDAGITAVTPNWCGDILTVRASAAAVESLLSLDLQTFFHTDANFTIVRATEPWSLPAHIAADVDTIFGLHAFPVTRAHVSHVGSNGMAPQAGKVTPSVLRSLYGINEQYSGSSSSSQGLAEFQHQGYSVSDLAKFIQEFNLPKQTVRNITGDGQTVIGHTEANLDVQYIMVTGSLIPTDFFVQKGNEFDLLAWSQDVAADPYSAMVWSVSYGEDIETIVSSFDDSYPTRFNTEVAKLGTLGKSILFASGDSGVYSRQSVDREFRPDFPASLPAITGVGATQLNFDGSEDTGTSFSGGGFCLSKYFTRSQDCTYQNTAVSNFFSKSSNLPPSHLYDNAGCGYPDVSAQGVNFQVVVNGITQGVSGTSASCPTVAGVVALLNDVRLTQGKSPLGWLNPLFYAHPEVFNDMTKGTNRGSGIYGFTAIEGWDPVTGLGTPNYPKLKQLVLSL
ncbi:hypothetical protein PTSG_01230 [Salpingoeca rosetta]|uniref:Peptidase S53 domain-containing protein n=1 Tax=Salpingoeca rosetta (strain ATCC 50818 / BSB-021) TaxID=946362 RepID=F2U168_SALR5|nr:uncharacterized protein PTSG_01230 [Salpingoeca rosetta]EGD80642.1 hypothetical protein PTSG_01230 [Salpingoeca rosetta]|eukprot:XP_004997203.1 hypothetical protein PTSG_01230 [Salpingoeca rosetta]